MFRYCALVLFLRISHSKKFQTEAKIVENAGFISRIIQDVSSCEMLLSNVRNRNRLMLYLRLSLT